MRSTIWRLALAGSGLLALALCVPGYAQGTAVKRAEVVAAMKKATTFMTDRVSLNGGYVWVVSEDLSRRWGEVPARPSQIWLQGGTERMGHVFLDAWEATGDAQFLSAARKAADALVFGQHPAGGWHYFIDFDPRGIPAWYATTASKFRWGYEEYRHYYGNATYDDQVTADAGRFLLRFYRLTQEAAYREPVLKSLEFALASQFPNGAWPQRFPLRDGYAHDGLPDYTGFYTLNDGAMLGIVEWLLDASETFADERYLAAATRGAESLLAMQGPEGQAGWGEQHGPDLRPIAARTHEPAGYVIRESVMSMRLLQEFYLLTGDQRFLAPVSRCLDWFERVNREIADRRYPVPRYWEPGSNLPLYVVRTDELTPDGYGKYLWTTDPAKTRCDGAPCKGDGKPLADVARLRAVHANIAALSTPAQRTARLQQMRRRQPPAARDGNVRHILDALDARGAWVTDGNSVPVANAPSDASARESVRGISTRVFVENLETLVAELRRQP
jgi:PelA/Pel-15E family pectate lyase